MVGLGHNECCQKPYIVLLPPTNSGRSCFRMPVTICVSQYHTGDENVAFCHVDILVFLCNVNTNTIHAKVQQINTKGFFALYICLIWGCFDKNDYCGSMTNRETKKLTSCIFPMLKISISVSIEKSYWVFHRVLQYMKCFWIRMDNFVRLC